MVIQPTSTNPTVHGRETGVKLMTCWLQVRYVHEKLAMEPGSRPSAAQPRTELNMATCPGYYKRTMEAACGHSYTPAARGLPATMRMKYWPMLATLSYIKPG